MKGPCGHLIDPARGFCTQLKCTPEWRALNSRSSGKGRSHLRHPSEDPGQGKRCPNCLGISGTHSGLGHCYLSACDRGVNGSRCGCHWALTRMGRPSGYEMAAKHKGDPRLRKWARTVI